MMVCFWHWRWAGMESCPTAERQMKETGIA